MDNFLSFLCAGVMILAVALDVIFNSASASIFLARKFMDLIELVAFWR